MPGAGGQDAISLKHHLLHQVWGSSTKLRASFQVQQDPTTRRPWKIPMRHGNYVIQRLNSITSTISKFKSKTILKCKRKTSEDLSDGFHNWGTHRGNHRFRLLSQETTDSGEWEQSTRLLLTELWNVKKITRISSYYNFDCWFVFHP